MRRHVIHLPAAVKRRPKRRRVAQIAGHGFNRQPVQRLPVRAGPDQSPDLRARPDQRPRHGGPDKPRDPCDQGFHDVENGTGAPAERFLRTGALLGIVNVQ